MYRLLIVDDEAIIADGLHEVFQGLKNPKLDIYKAYSGQEAMGILNRTRIDIVLTDIHMPGMNGLQLLEQIHRFWPKCRVIFLTGYNEFDYVYTAIQYEGVSYLLKTEGYDKVIAAVNDAIEEIEKSFRQDALIKEAIKQIGATKDLLRENFLAGISQGRFLEKEINQQQFDELGITLSSHERVIMLVGRIDDLPKGLPYSEKTRRLYSVGLIMEQYLNFGLHHVRFIDENSHLVWFIQPGNDTEEDEEFKWNKCLTVLRGNAELIQNCCLESIHALVSFALDDSPARWIEIPDRFATLKMVLNYRIGKDSAMLVTDRRVMEKELKVIQEKSSEKLATHRLQFGMLAETLEYGKRDDFLILLDHLTENLKVTQSMHNIVALERYASIALVLLSYINRWNIIERVAFKIGIHKLLNAQEHDSWNDAVEYLRHLGGILIDIQNHAQEKRAQDVIGFIQKHINDNIHIQDEITLIRLADLVHFNPSYLSRLFKQVVGMNLSDYISEIRIKKAKQLLENQELKINAVAEALGYGTATNFTRFFKKITNMTPQEYRDFINPNNQKHLPGIG